MEDPVHSRCRQLLEQKFNRGSSQNWLDVDFESLREEIHQITRILISKNTLKRYFGKLNTSEGYDPQRETKNALAQYLGYSDWHQLETSFREEPENKNPPPVEKLPGPTYSAPRGQDKRIPARVWLWIGLLGCTLVLSWLIFWQKDPDSNWSFEVENPVDTAPYSLISRQSGEFSPEDSFYVKMEKPEFLGQGDSLLTTTIPYPTYTWIIFGHKQRQLKAVPIHALSQGWEVFYRRFPGKNQIRVPGKFQSGPDGWGVSKAWIRQNGLDSINYFQEFLNFRNYPVDGDNFSAEFESTLKEQESLCKLLTIRIFGSQKHIEYRIGPSFCAQHNFLSISEKFIFGRKMNLTRMVHPLNRKVRSRIDVIDKKVTLSVDGFLVFSGTYSQPVGPLKGIRVSIEGDGQIHSIRLWKKGGALIESSPF